MARIRTIKPEFWGDEKLAPLAPIHRLVFLGLISQADDAGRLLDNVRLLNGLLFPESEDSCRDSLEVLAGLDRIVRYVSASGQRLIQIVNWSDHQRVKNPSSYTLPGPDDSGSQVSEPQHDSESSGDSTETLRRSGGESNAPILDLGSTIPEQRSTIGEQGSTTDDQKLKFRVSEIEAALIEENGFVSASDIPSVGAFLAGLNAKVAEREALDFEDISYTLNAFFPPERPGAGTNPAVKAWLGRIPEQTIGSALRYLHVQTYTVDGEEKTWGQLTDDHCKRLITAGLNAILRERAHA